MTHAPPSCWPCIEMRELSWRGLLGSMGTNVWIESPLYCDYGANIHIGNNCFVNYNCIFIDGNSISIGNDVLVGRTGGSVLYRHLPGITVGAGTTIGAGKPCRVIREL